MQVGGSYYLTHTSVSPYIGLGASPRLYVGAYDGGGLTVNGQVGLMFLREASTRFYAEVRVDQNVIKLRQSLQAIYASGTTAPDRSAAGSLPTELTLAVGFGF